MPSRPWGVGAGCLPWGILSVSPAPWYRVPSPNRSKRYRGLCTDWRQEATRRGWFPALKAGWGWTGAQSTRCREKRRGQRGCGRGANLWPEKCPKSTCQKGTVTATLLLGTWKHKTKACSWTHSEKHKRTRELWSSVPALVSMHWKHKPWRCGVSQSRYKDKWGSPSRQEA